MTTALYAMHKTDEAKVLAVMDEMRNLGAPKIRVVDMGDHYQAIEGCHRIEAASRLGLELDLEILDAEEIVSADSLDLQDLRKDATAGEIAELVFDARQAVPYKLDQDDEPTIWRAI